MNSSYPGFNASSPSPTTTGGSALSSLTTALSLSTAGPSDAHDPGVTIMVVLGLAVLLAGVSAFLAVRRSGGGSSDSAGGLFCGPRGGLGASGRSAAAAAGEPQLKVWKRLGSYRRCYNVSFRRPPPPRRAHGARSPGPGGGGAGQTLGPGGGAEPSAAVPCLFDYVTEI